VKKKNDARGEGEEKRGKKKRRGDTKAVLSAGNSTCLIYSLLPPSGPRPGAGST